MTERAVVLANARGEELVGVWHAPQDAPRAALVMLHGWSGTRSGPHQMLTRAARRLGAAGFGVLRFDFAGRGDSDGDTELATLATMRDDALAARAWVSAQTGAPLLLLGLCSGCEIAVAAADEEVAGAVLWSAPVFAALPDAGIAARKRGANLRRYARKLLQVSTYLKIARGQVDAAGVSQALAGAGGGASKNRESGTPGQLPPGFRGACLARWRDFEAPRLQVYGSADPIAPGALRWYQENGRAPDVEWIEGANHSFYGLDGERQVIERTAAWLEARWPPR